MIRLPTLWQTTSLASSPRTPGDTDVQHFGRMVEYLKQLQEQLEPQSQHKPSLSGRILDSLTDQSFWVNLVGRDFPSANALTGSVERLLHVRAQASPHSHTQTTIANASTPTNTPAFLVTTSTDQPPPLVTPRLATRVPSQSSATQLTRPRSIGP